MKIQAVKGTRDLYPEVLAPIRHIFDAWRSTSILHGFEEFDGPTLEMLDLYREKSGEELVGQLYRLTDSGGRELALRPEMTPTLARMVAARLSSLPRPIKWFCIPTLFRGENVQRGRLREFFQWNVDIIGSPESIADAECILVGVEALRLLGLTSADFAVHISSRRVMGDLLTALGLAPDNHARAYGLLDKAGKLPREEMARRWDEAFGKTARFDSLERLLGCADLAALQASWPGGGGGESLANLEQLWEHLRNFNILDFCKLDLGVVRGLAYYTGVVFEFYDRSENERAICGGGRYDDLLAKVGRESQPAVGFGMGDVVLSLILQEKRLLDSSLKKTSVFVIDASEKGIQETSRVAAALRRGGVAADFSYTIANLGRQLKTADKRGCMFAVILGLAPEKPDTVRIKKMAGGQERDVSLKELLSDPVDFLEIGGP